MKAHKALIILLFIWSNVASAQYKDSIPDLSIDEHKVDINIKAQTFIYNEEFTKYQSYGATYIGAFLRPQLNFTLGQKSVLSTGIHLQKFSGKDTLHQAIPYLTIDYKINRHHRILLGRIYGTSYHQLDESLLNYRRYYLDQVESGMQYIIKYDRLYIDTWLHWDRFILKGDPYTEKIISGSNIHYDILNGKQRLSFTFQGLLVHYGGQIDASDEPVVTLINISPGLRYSIKNGLFLGANYFRFIPKDNPFYSLNGIPIRGSKHDAYKFTIGYHSKTVQSALSYWKNNNYAAPLGEYLYDNTLPKYQSDAHTRSLIKGEVIYQQKIDDRLTIKAISGWYYLLDESSLHYTLGINMTARIDGILKK